MSRPKHRIRPADAADALRDLPADAGLWRDPIVWIVPLVIVVATIVTFWPATANDFVNWDDHRNFLQNRAFRGLGLEQIKWAFGTRLLGVYQPLSWIVLSAQYVMFELNPSGYHAISVLLHAATAVVFYLIVLRLLPLAMPQIIERLGPAVTTPLAFCAGIASAAYALHPLRTETVAWASSQPYVLSMLFFLLTLLCYVNAADRADGKFGWLWYTAAILTYLCCVLSKAIGVMLPVALMVMDVYPLRRIGGSRGWPGPRIARLLLEKLPFFVLAALTALLGTIATDTNDPMSQQLGTADRIALGLYGLAFYVYKTLVPTNLLPYYPIPRPFNPMAVTALIAAGFIVGLTVLFVAIRKRFPGGLAAWAYYVIMLVPVLGIVQHGSQIAADRYTYLSCLVWPIMLAAGLLWLWQAKRSGSRAGAAFYPAIAVAVVAAGALTPLSWSQTHVWRDSKTLWTYVLDRAGPCDYAHNNLGTALEPESFRDKKIAAEVLAHYERAVEIEPKNYKAQRNVGVALNRAGRRDEAEKHLRAAIDVYPDYANAHNSLGLVLEAKGQHAEAIECFKRAIALGKSHRNEIAEPYVNLAIVLQTTGRRDEAIEYLKTAIALARRNGDEIAQPYSILAKIYATDSEHPRINEAIELWKTALRIDPSRSLVRKELAGVLGNQKRYKEALSVLEEGLKVNPSDAGTAANLAWMLATAPNASDRDGPRAVRLAEAAVKSQPSEDPRMLNALAAAYAEAGRYDEALKTLARAINIAHQRKDQALVDQLTPFLMTYRSHKPYHMPAK